MTRYICVCGPHDESWTLELKPRSKGYDRKVYVGMMPARRPFTNQKVYVGMKARRYRLESLCRGHARDKGWLEATVGKFSWDDASAPSVPSIGKIMLG